MWSRVWHRNCSRAPMWNVPLPSPAQRSPRPISVHPIPGSECGARPMARSKSITPETLATLGSETLAAVLVKHAESEPGLRKKLRMLLAGTEGPSRLKAEIGKRIQTIGRSRSFVDWDKRKALVKELDHLRTTIATSLAAHSPGERDRPTVGLHRHRGAGNRTRGRWCRRGRRRIRPGDS